MRMTSKTTRDREADPTLTWEIKAWLACFRFLLSIVVCIVMYWDATRLLPSNREQASQKAVDTWYCYLESLLSYLSPSRSHHLRNHQQATTHEPRERIGNTAFYVLLVWAQSRAIPTTFLRSLESIRAILLVRLGLTRPQTSMVRR